MAKPPKTPPSKIEDADAHHAEDAGDRTSDDGSGETNRKENRGRPPQSTR